MVLNEMDPTRMIGQTSLSIAYGIDVAPRDNPIITQTHEAFEAVYLCPKTRVSCSTLFPHVRPNYSGRECDG
jgi:hypothetical protein